MTAHAVTYDITCTGGTHNDDLTPWLTGITVSLDADRTPFAAAGLTFTGMPVGVGVLETGSNYMNLLDPRQLGGAHVRFRIDQKDEAGRVVSVLPGSHATTVDTAVLADLFVQTADTDGRTTTVEAGGYETLLRDKLRVGAVLDPSRFGLVVSSPRVRALHGGEHHPPSVGGSCAHRAGRRISTSSRNA